MFGTYCPLSGEEADDMDDKPVCKSLHSDDLKLWHQYAMCALAVENTWPWNCGIFDDVSHSFAS